VVEVDPCYQKHCMDAILVQPDNSKCPIKVLRDTGALQSLVSSSIVQDHEITFRGEKRLIRGVTGDAVALPLVKMNVISTLFFSVALLIRCLKVLHRL